MTPDIVDFAVERAIILEC